ncbi:hypothetical protein CHS0354_001204 [Potamilus streckersoni]|uniref:Cyclase n=1 Tax=Potamilus streckersoni TaxID=2493646 RepID=A0AAE0RMS6_9BIVA|nr:hypothetical protein CHS0354_001204 [Potamilus streckersoni]
MATEYMMKQYIYDIIILFGIIAVQGHQKLRVIDMTHTLSPSTVYWPGSPAYNFTQLFRGITQPYGFWYESNFFGTPEHGGTHLDAPAHFAQDGWHLHQIPMDKLAGPGIIINIKDKAANDSDYQVNVDDLMNWESKYGRIPNGSVVLMNSGWALHYPNKTLVFGSSTPNDPSSFHFPGFHENAANWLINERSVNVIGVDTPSTDYGQSKNFSTHQVLGKTNVPGLENVANLDMVPEDGSARVYVAALKLHDGSGGPARVFATVEEISNSSK